MFLFLQDWRSTIIPAITIPVSLVGTFAFVKLLGFSINTLTLFGIVLATGIVVDDAIVVIENIQRHIQEYGRTARQAASEAMGEVLGAVIATALVLIAVFVPVAFFPGTTGRLYQQFSLTIAFSVALSAFNAVTLTPALSALLLREGAARRARSFRFVERDHRGRHRLLRAHARRGASRGPLRSDGAAVRRCAGRDRTGSIARVPQRVSARRGPGLLHHRRFRRRKARRSSTRATSRKQVEQVLRHGEGHRQRVHGRRLQLLRARRPNRGILFIRLKPFDERTRRRRSRRRPWSARLRGPLWRHQRARSSCRSCRRRSAASARLAGSSSKCSTRPAAPIENLAGGDARTSCSGGQPVSRSCAGCSPRSRPATRSSTSTSTASASRL